jgi:hypothetical protein
VRRPGLKTVRFDHRLHSRPGYSQSKTCPKYGPGIFARLVDHLLSTPYRRHRVGGLQDFAEDIKAGPVTAFFKCNDERGEGTSLRSEVGMARVTSHQGFGQKLKAETGL